MSSTKVDPHLKLLEAARAGDIEDAKYWFNKGGSIQMAVMGAGDVMEGNVQFDAETKHDKKAREAKEAWIDNVKTIGKWAMENGGCFLWSFTQGAKQSKFSVLKYNKNISMLKGPGEVARGTFNNKDSKE